jgi:hypothetical protein
VTTPSSVVTPFHVLTLSGECDGCGPVPHDAPCVNRQHSYDYTLTCPGVTDSCRFYQECLTCTAEETRALNEDDTEEAHGVEHHLINGLWMVPTDRCFIADHDHQGEAVAYLGPLPPGSYPVDGEDIGDGDLGLTLALRSDRYRDAP